MSLAKMADAGDDRIRSQARQNQSDDESRRDKGKRYVTNMLGSLDPKSPTFADDWSGHLSRLRAAGYDIGPEYDNPRKGYDTAMAEVYGAKGVIDRRERVAGARVAGWNGRATAQPGPAVAPTAAATPTGASLAAPLAPDASSGGDQPEPSAMMTIGAGAPWAHSEVAGSRQQGAERRTFSNVPNEDATPPHVDQARLEQLMQEQKRYRSIAGRKPKAGYIWAVDEGGNLYEKPTLQTPRSPKDERKDASIDMFLQDLQDAKAVLVGPNDANGKPRTGLAADISGIAERGAAEATGGLVRPAVRQAIESTKHAIVQLTAMVEGNRHANAQDVRFLSYFVPTWKDNQEMVAFKLSQAHRIFSAMRGSGVDQTLALTELRRSAKAIRDNQLPGSGSDLRPTSGPDQIDRRSTGGAGWSIKRID